MPARFIVARHLFCYHLGKERRTAMTSYYPYQPTGIIWVSGEAGAKAYLVAPNNTVQLWDSESQTIYLKSADACGMPTIKTLDYTVRDTQAPQIDAISNKTYYATLEDIKSLNERISALEGKKKKEKEE